MSEGPQKTPRTWLVLGDKLGDNAQVRIIVEALGWPVETRNLVFLERYRLGKPPFKASLYHLDRARSDPLEPPWPELIITVGRRPAMAALWIQRQSGGRTRIVLLGRPKKWLERFSLVLVPAQYQVPEHPTVLSLGLPLMRVDAQRLEAAREAWREPLANLPRPLVVMLVGGPTKPFKMDERVVEALLSRARELLAAQGGSLYITTSRRTPPEVVRALEQGLPEEARLFAWGADGGENPYLGLLAHGDQFIVTGDSVSMMVEVARLGKSLAIYDLPVRGGMGRRLQAWFAGWSRRSGLGARLAHGLHRLGLAGYGRDLTAIHRELYRLGAAVPLGEPFPAHSKPLGDADLEQVVERIETLWAEGSGQKAVR